MSRIKKIVSTLDVGNITKQKEKEVLFLRVSPIARGKFLRAAKQLNIKTSDLFAKMVDQFFVIKK